MGYVSPNLSTTDVEEGYRKTAAFGAAEYRGDFFDSLVDRPPLTADDITLIREMYGDAQYPFSTERGGLRESLLDKFEAEENPSPEFVELMKDIHKHYNNANEARIQTKLESMGAAERTPEAPEKPEPEERRSVLEVARDPSTTYAEVNEAYARTSGFYAVDARGAFFDSLDARGPVDAAGASMIERMLDSGVGSNGEYERQLIDKFSDEVYAGRPSAEFIDLMYEVRDDLSRDNRVALDRDLDRLGLDPQTRPELTASSGTRQTPEPGNPDRLSRREAITRGWQEEMDREAGTRTPSELTAEQVSDIALSIYRGEASTMELSQHADALREGGAINQKIQEISKVEGEVDNRFEQDIAGAWDAVRYMAADGASNRAQVEAFLNDRVELPEMREAILDNYSDLERAAEQNSGNLQALNAGAITDSPDYDAIFTRIVREAHSAADARMTGQMNEALGTQTQALAPEEPSNEDTPEASAAERLAAARADVRRERGGNDDEPAADDNTQTPAPPRPNTNNDSTDPAVVLAAQDAASDADTLGRDTEASVGSFLEGFNLNSLFQIIAYAFTGQIDKIREMFAEPVTALAQTPAETPEDAPELADNAEPEPTVTPDVTAETELAASGNLSSGTPENVVATYTGQELLVEMGVSPVGMMIPAGYEGGMSDLPLVVAPADFTNDIDPAAEYSLVAMHDQNGNVDGYALHAEGQPVIGIPAENAPGDLAINIIGPAAPPEAAIADVQPEETSEDNTNDTTIDVAYDEAIEGFVMPDGSHALSAEDLGIVSGIGVNGILSGSGSSLHGSMEEILITSPGDVDMSAFIVDGASYTIQSVQGRHGTEGYLLHRDDGQSAAVFAVDMPQEIREAVCEAENRAEHHADAKPNEPGADGPDAGPNEEHHSTLRGGMVLHNGM